MPVNTIAKPSSLARAMTSSSFSLPPGWITTVAPALTAQSKTITGFATYYTVASAKSEETSGIFTASGKRFVESAMTCALPRSTAKVWNIKYGASVRITNTMNGRTVTAVYLDRGPGRKSRSRGVIADLTPKAFILLGGNLSDGRIKIKIELLK